MLVSLGGAALKKASPRVATLGRHGVAKTVEGVQRFSVAKAFFARLWAVYQGNCRKKGGPKAALPVCRAVLPLLFFGPNGVHAVNDHGRELVSLGCEYAFLAIT